MTETTLEGSVLALVLFDLCEEIRLEQLQQIIGARTVEPTFKHSAPEYVRFQRPPVVEPLDPIALGDGEVLHGEMKYYDYGVISVVFELRIKGDWSALVGLASRWMTGPELEAHATRLAQEKVKRTAAPWIRPYSEWLSEDYFIFQLKSRSDPLTAAELLARRGVEIAQIVRGEPLPLSDAERNEVLQSSISYYPTDLTVIGWNAALVYDTPSGAETAIQLIEYANSQLLEFRHYDELLTRELNRVYRTLERGTGLWARWRLESEATRLHRVLLEVMELSERADNAIKFLSDMFSARLYRLAAAKIGVPDYKDLVNRKLRTVEEIYGVLVGQFQQARAFVLELMVVIILVVELIMLFRGKS